MKLKTLDLEKENLKEIQNFLIENVVIDTQSNKNNEERKRKLNFFDKFLFSIENQKNEILKFIFALLIMFLPPLFLILNFWEHLKYSYVAVFVGFFISFVINSGIFVCIFERVEKKTITKKILLEKILSEIKNEESQNALIDDFKMLNKNNECLSLNSLGKIILLEINKKIVFIKNKEKNDAKNKKEMEEMKKAIKIQQNMW